jgi:hypothetical protein
VVMVSSNGHGGTWHVKQRGFHSFSIGSCAAGLQAPQINAVGKWGPPDSQYSTRNVTGEAENRVPGPQSQPLSLLVLEAAPNAMLDHLFTIV